ncbi:MAG: VWA domain-containing protein [Luminiphilus sp.]|nr:VWA domain-containing protein [Luminiphilus sp.]
MIDDGFNLLRPQAFWLLIALPPALFMLWRSVQTSASWAKVIDPHLLPHLMSNNTKTAKKMGHWWTLLWLLMAIITIAGPSLQKIDIPVFQRADALVIVLDLSASMSAADIQPSRVQRAKQKILDLLTSRDEGVTGLVVYAGDAHVVAPLTDDRRTIENLLSALTPNIMPLPGSDVTAALRVAVGLLQTAGVANGQVLLITDGMPKFQAADISDELSAARAELAILGVGTRSGAPIPRADGGFLRQESGEIVIPSFQPGVLANHAGALGGRFTEITLDNRDIDLLLQRSTLLDLGEIALDRETDSWLDQSNWLALILGISLLPLFRRGALAALLIVPLLSPAPASAQLLSGLWQTPDQRGARALEQGDANAAANLFEDDAWRGTAQYSAENWQDAADSFKKGDDADHWYNQGNALAMSGKLEQALEAFNQSLALMPEAEDALRNRELVEQLLEQQEQQSQEDQDREQDSNNDESSDDQEGSSEQDQEGDSQQQDSDDSQGNSESDPSQQNASDGDSGNTSPQDGKASDSESAAETDNDQETTPLSEEMQARLDAQTEEQMGKFDAGLEKQQALEQWLRRVPDDPGGLLQRKFRYETIQRLRQGEEPDEDVRW